MVVTRGAARRQQRQAAEAAEAAANANGNINNAGAGRVAAPRQRQAAEAAANANGNINNAGAGRVAAPRQRQAAEAAANNDDSNIPPSLVEQVRMMFAAREEENRREDDVRRNEVADLQAETNRRLEEEQRRQGEEIIWQREELRRQDEVQRTQARELGRQDIVQIRQGQELLALGRRMDHFETLVQAEASINAGNGVSSTPNNPTPVNIGGDTPQLQLQQNSDDRDLDLVIQTMRRVGVFLDNDVVSYCEGTREESAATIMERILSEIFTALKMDSPLSIDDRAILFPLFIHAARILGKEVKDFLPQILKCFSYYTFALNTMNEKGRGNDCLMKVEILKSYPKFLEMLQEKGVDLETLLISKIQNFSLDIDKLKFSPIKLEVSGEERQSVDEEKAREIVASWTDELSIQREKVRDILGNDATESEVRNVILCDRISLSGKSYSPEASNIIAAFLSGPFEGGRSLSSGILDAQLGDIIAGLQTAEGLHVLRTICDAFADSNRLKILNLSNNAIGLLGIRLCTTLLSKSSLQAIELCDNGLSAEAMEIVAHTLTQDESGNGCVAANLSKIHFFNNNSGDEGCRHLASILENCSNLKDLRFASTHTGRAGTDMITSALVAALEDGRNVGLGRLDLNDNNFGNRASQDDLRSILERTRTSLYHLDIGWCSLGSEGVAAVCDVLVSSESSLEHLDLSGNGVESQGAEQIADYIRNCGGKLKVLCLDDNDLTSEGVLHITSAFLDSESGRSIEILELNSTMCDDIGARALIEASANLPNLNKICLDSNFFQEEIIRALVDVFGDKLEEMEENDPNGEADDDVADDDSNEEADDNDVPDVAGDDVPPDVDSFLADHMSRLSMNSS